MERERDRTPTPIARKPTARSAMLDGSGIALTLAGKVETLANSKELKFDEKVTDCHTTPPLAVKRTGSAKGGVGVTSGGVPGTKDCAVPVALGPV